MGNLLSLRFENDNDGTGELFAVVQQGEYSGASSAWFAIEELQAFGKALQQQFPLRLDAPIKLEGGSWARSGAPGLEEIHLGLTIYPIGSTGAVGVRVELATRLHSNERPGAKCSVSVELQTNMSPSARSGTESLQ